MLWTKCQFSLNSQKRKPSKFQSSGTCISSKHRMLAPLLFACLSTRNLSATAKRICFWCVSCLYFSSPISHSLIFASKGRLDIQLKVLEWIDLSSSRLFHTSCIWSCISSIACIKRSNSTYANARQQDPNWNIIITKLVRRILFLSACQATLVYMSSGRHTCSRACFPTNNRSNSDNVNTILLLCVTWVVKNFLQSNKLFTKFNSYIRLRLN